MKDDQITALAREYAEETYKDIEDGRIRKPMIDSLAKGTEDSFLYLLRRFALVEKSKVEQIHKEAVECKAELEKMQPQNTYVKNSIAMKIGVNMGCVHTLKSLFPGLGKEVRP